MEQTENIQKPQNYGNDDHGIQDGLNGAFHGNEAIDQPEENTDDDQDQQNIDQGHGGTFLYRNRISRVRGLFCPLIC